MCIRDRVQCGGDGGLEKIVATVNERFAALRPDLPPVRPQQITYVNTDQGRMFVKFYRSFKTAPQRVIRGSTDEYFENSWATYRNSGEETFVTVRTKRERRR